MSPSTNISDESPAFRRGPGGRPTRAEAERRHLLLLDTAARLFIAKGLDGVSMEAIAEEAGVAKRFVYARYRDKEELFVATVKRLIEERIAFLEAYDVGDEPVDQGLLVFAQILERGAVQPEALALYRIIIAELHRFPSLTYLFAEQMARHVMGGVLRVLQIYESRGEISFDNPLLTAELFLTLIVHGARGRALFGIESTAVEREHRTAAAVRMFLNGCRSRSPTKP